MARGKNAAKSANRRRKELERLIEEMTADLAAEERALAAAEAALAKTEQLRAEVRTEVLDTQEETSGYSQALNDELDYTRSVLIAYSEPADGALDIAEKYIGRCIEVSPGSTHTEQLESFMAALGLGGFLNEHQANTTTFMSSEDIVRLQRIRGERSLTNQPDTSIQDSRINTNRLMNQTRAALDADRGPRWFYPLDGYPDATVAPDGVIIEALDVLASSDSHTTAEVLHAWGTGPFVNQASVTGDLPKALGYQPRRTRGTSFGAPVPHEPQPGDLRSTREEVADLLFSDTSVKKAAEDEESLDIPRPTASMSPDDRQDTAAKPPGAVFAEWKRTFDARHALAEQMGYSARSTVSVPRHPRPSYGAVSQHLYSRAAFAGWLHHGSDADLTAEVAAGMTAAATYWLPTGQTAAFANSEPPSQVELTSMALPFPQIFVAFADPVAIAPTEDDSEGILKAVSNMAHRADEKIMLLRDIENGLVRLLGEQRALEVSVSEIAAVAGVQIDGILLLSDELGQPEDLFAWCLRVPGQYSSSIARLVIPALRSKTEYRHLVDNITAVTAWAHWHQPSSEDPRSAEVSGVEGRERLRRLEREGAGVHIVDTSRTKGRAPKESTGSPADTRNVAPHTRRAHWRKQRYGQGLAESRMVHIAATVVNIHRGNMQHQVYTLPAPA